MDGRDLWIVISFILTTVSTIIFCSIIRSFCKVIDNDDKMIKAQEKMIKAQEKTIKLYADIVNLQNIVIEECEKLTQIDNEGDIE